PRRLPIHEGFFCEADVDVADIDGDGDLDILVTSDGSIGSELLINRGDAFFTNEIVARVPDAGPDSWGWHCAKFLDIDGDGDLDFVRAGMERDPELLINDGRVFFIDGTYGQRGGLPPLAGRISPVGAASGDLDGDGDPDIVLASNNIFGGEPGARPYDRLL